MTDVVDSLRFFVRLAAEAGVSGDDATRIVQSEYAAMRRRRALDRAKEQRAAA